MSVSQCSGQPIIQVTNATVTLGFPFLLASMAGGAILDVTVSQCWMAGR